MANLEITPELQVVIKDYLLYTFSTKDTPQQLQDFLARLPQSFVEKVQIHVLNQIMAANIHIGHLATDPRAEGLIPFIANRMKIVLAAPEEFLVREGNTLDGTVYLFAVICL